MRNEREICIYIIIHMSVYVYIYLYTFTGNCACRRICYCRPYWHVLCSYFRSRDTLRKEGSQREGLFWGWVEWGMGQGCFGSLAFVSPSHTLRGELNPNDVMRNRSPAPPTVR